MTEYGSSFARHLSLALTRAGWQWQPGQGRWTHDGSGCVVELDVGFAAWLCVPGQRPRPVGSRKRDAERAAMDVAEQCWEAAARLSMQSAPDAP